MQIGYPFHAEHTVYNTFAAERPHRWLQNMYRPFFLPCLVVGIVSFVALLCSLVVMDETLPSIVAKKYSALALSDSDPLSVAQQEVSHLPGDSAMLAWTVYRSFTPVQSCLRLGGELLSMVEGQILM